MNVREAGENATRMVSRVFKHAKIPYADKYISNLSGGFRQVLSLAVRDTLICFDDFERSGLSSKSLLGLISDLCDQRRCKAVIILNEDALDNDERADFRRYFEKVIDVAIEMAPTPSECAEIAVKGDNAVNMEIKQNTIALGISNIRIVRRIKDFSVQLEDTLSLYGTDVMQQAVRSLALFVWSKHDDDAIPTKFIVERSNIFLRLEKNERTEEEKKWGPVLDKYGHSYCDSFDLELLAGVQRGYFDRTRLNSEAAQQDARAAQLRGQEAIRTAWKFFHGSFSDNVHDVIAAVYTAYSENIGAASAGNIDDTLQIFRQLGFPDEAANLIEIYVHHHKGDISSSDEGDNPFHPTVKDEEFRKALAAVAVAPTPRSVKENLIAISGQSYSREDEEAAQKLSSDDFYDIFKYAEPAEVESLIEASLFWRRVANATKPQSAMTACAVEALRRLGKESPLNAIRVRKYGIGETD